MVWAIIETPFEPLDHGADIKRATLEHPKPYAIADLSPTSPWKPYQVFGELCVCLWLKVRYCRLHVTVYIRGHIKSIHMLSKCYRMRAVSKFLPHAQKLLRCPGF